MNKVLLVILTIALLSGCTSRTEFGDCVGLADDKKPELIYKVSAWNIVVSILFAGLIAPPVYVLVDETFCPVGRK